MDPLNKMPIAKVKEKFRFCFFLFLHSIFSIEKKCVLTILKAINHKTINSKHLVAQDMREGRVSWQITFMKCSHILSIVTETNHKGAVCLF